MSIETVFTQIALVVAQLRYLVLPKLFMTKPFSELRKQMTPEQREESETCFQLALLHLALAQLQESLEVTPNELQQKLQQLRKQEGG